MEGEDLVDAVARFDQEPDDVDAVSYLHLGGEAFLIEQDKELIASLRRREKDSKADQIVRDRIAQAMDEDEARVWARRLAFPMLDADELRTVREASLTTDQAIQTKTPSFLIECLVWNVPNEGFGHDTLRADVRYTLAHLCNETRTGG